MYDISGGEPQRVVVIGQGYVGLPVAIRAVEVGFEVVGFDIDKTRIDCLRKSETFIDDITDRDLAIAMSTGRYLPTDDSAALAGFDVAVVCVPTPLRDGAPDLSYVEDAAVLITPHITPGCCVILESTRATPVPPRRSSSRSSKPVRVCARGRSSSPATAPSASTRETRSGGSRTLRRSLRE